MKKILLTAMLLASCFAFKANAQLHISLGLNIGSQPDWGPTGYDHAEFYYIPDADAYYDVPNHQYVYMQGNAWVRGAALPGNYHFDPYNSYKVVVNEPTPWVHAATYRAKYKSFKGRKGQPVIRDSRDTKYHDHWNGNNNGHGNDRGHDDHGKGHDDHGHDDHGHHR